MRGVYSKASYMIHNPNGEVSPLLWTKKVLGHQSYNSVKHYDGVIVARGEIAKPVDIPMLLTELMARVAALESERQVLTDAAPRSVRIVVESKRKREEEDIVLVKFDLENGSGQIDLQKFKRTRNKTADEEKELVERAEAILAASGVAPTRENIKRLGIGTATAARYKAKKLKAWETMTTARSSSLRRASTRTITYACPFTPEQTRMTLMRRSS